MQTEIIIAGFGGQGVLFGGTVLAQAALEEGKHTTWFPAYGAEMRGGTANSTVIISDEEIGSPVVVSPSALIALNGLSMEKFAPRMKQGSFLVFNSSLVKNLPEYKGIKSFEIAATDIADKELKDVRTANMVALGAYLKASGILSLASAKKACAVVLAEKQKLIPLNQKALEMGYNFIKP